MFRKYRLATWTQLATAPMMLQWPACLRASLKNGSSVIFVVGKKLFNAQRLQT
jgi:hypothetical protein